MKRSIMASILGCIAVVLCSVLLVGQTPEKQKAPSKQTRKSMPAAKTQAKATPGQKNYKPFQPKDATKGAEISASLDSDRTGNCPAEPDRKPEVAYLSLSAEQYQAFMQDGVGFVNNYRVFNCPVREMRHLSRSGKKAMPKKPSAGGDPLVAVVHDPDCGGYWYDVPY